MKQYTCSIVTTYNYWFTLTVKAANHFSARRIANKWAKGKYFSDSIHRIYINEYTASNEG